MPSIDTLCAAIRTALEQARQLLADLGSTREQATEVRDRLGALGVENSAAQAGVTVDNWDDEDVREALAAVAERPHTTERARPGMWRATGTHRGIEVQVMVRDDGGIEAGWPRGGPGVQRNPPARRK